jgi:hypothetical protein
MFDKNQFTPYFFSIVFIMFACINCSPEEQPIEPESYVTEQTEPLDTPTESFTISGIHTVLSLEEKECTTCTFIVPATASLIDGKELDLNPGDVICLDKALRYGNLEFINIDGDLDNPVIIGYTRSKGIKQTDVKLPGESS